MPYKPEIVPQSALLSASLAAALAIAGCSSHEDLLATQDFTHVADWDYIKTEGEGIIKGQATIGAEATDASGDADYLELTIACKDNENIRVTERDLSGSLEQPSYMYCANDAISTEEADLLFEDVRTFITDLAG